MRRAFPVGPGHGKGRSGFLSQRAVYFPLTKSILSLFSIHKELSRKSTSGTIGIDPKSGVLGGREAFFFRIGSLLCQHQSQELEVGCCLKIVATLKPRVHSDDHDCFCI